MKGPKPTDPIYPLILNAIYRVTEAQKILGLGRRTMDRLKREGLPVRRVAQKHYVKSDDLWDAMERVSYK